jgi:SPP1 gp7 family putative phage head morphogenesis protein
LTANEDFMDALIRHQIGLMQFSGHLRNRVIRRLDATEKRLKELIASRTARIAARGGVDLGPATTRRLRSLEKLVGNLRRTAFDGALKEVTAELRQLSLDEAAFVQGSLQKASPVVLDVQSPDPARLRAIASHNPFQGQTVRGWFRSMRTADLNRIMQEVRTGLVLGDSNQVIARRVAGTVRLRGADGVTQLTRNQAQAVVRTAVNGVSNEAKKLVYAENREFIKEEMFVATLDSRTTVICMSLDGTRHKVLEGPRPPMHVQCRSLRVAVIDGQVIGDRPAVSTTRRDLEGLSRAERRARIRELTGQVPANTTYEQFLRRQSIQFQNEVLGVKKATLFREGKLPLSKFVDRRGNELTLKQLRTRDPEAFRRAGLRVGAGRTTDAARVFQVDPSASIGGRTSSLIRQGFTNDEIAARIREEFPDAKTTAKSVASTRSRLKKAGQIPTTIGASIEGLLLDGLPDAQILTAIKRLYPNANTTIKSIQSVKSRLKKAGRLGPQRPGPPPRPRPVPPTPRPPRRPPPEQPKPGAPARPTKPAELARELIKEGKLTNLEILEEVKRRFPDARTTLASIRSMRSVLKKAGLAKAEPKKRVRPPEPPQPKKALPRTDERYAGQLRFDGDNAVNVSIAKDALEEWPALTRDLMDRKLGRIYYGDDRYMVDFPSGGNSGGVFFSRHFTANQRKHFDVRVRDTLCRQVAKKIGMNGGTAVRGVFSHEIGHALDRLVDGVSVSIETTAGRTVPTVVEVAFKNTGGFGNFWSEVDDLFKKSYQKALQVSKTQRQGKFGYSLTNEKEFFTQVVQAIRARRQMQTGVGRPGVGLDWHMANKEQVDLFHRVFPDAVRRVEEVFDGWI